MTETNALVIKLVGHIESSNFDQYKEQVIQQIRSSNKDLKTDDDFSNAQENIKNLKNAEKQLLEAKESALKQAEEIQTLFSALDEVSTEARDARLSLEKQVEKRKQEIKEEKIKWAIDIVDQRIRKHDLLSFTDCRKTYLDRSVFEAAIKGKKKLSSMEEALSNASADAIRDLDALNDKLQRNQERVSSIDSEYKPYFQDLKNLITMEPCVLEETIAQRILNAEEAKKEKERREEAAKKERERRQEEERRANQERAERIALQQREKEQEALKRIEEASKAKQQYEEVTDEKVPNPSPQCLSQLPEDALKNHTEPYDPKENHGPKEHFIVSILFHCSKEKMEDMACTINHGFMQNDSVKKISVDRADKEHPLLKETE